MSSPYSVAIGKLIRREDLLESEAEAVMAELMDGALEPASIAALLTALTMKGETAAELCGFARAMRARSVRVAAPPGAIDTCGTGGSGKPKPNVSTLCALILAAEGVPVAKHGNRSTQGRCGSADVLEKLGLAIDLSPEKASQLLERERLAFLFAPRYHPAMKHAAPVRRQIGFRSTFNFLGPLANPAFVRRQVLGVSDPSRAPLVAEALLRLGVDRAWVLTGPNNVDEITLEGPTLVFAIEGDSLREARIDPSAYNLREGDLGPSGTIEENTAAFQAVLENRAPPALMDLVALNAAAALVVADRATDLAEGLHQARTLLATGAARAKLDSYKIEGHTTDPKLKVQP